MDKNKITIATHNGSFHADDVFAVAALLLVCEKKYNTVRVEEGSKETSKEIYKEIYNVEVIRSRDKEVLEKATHVVDVGGVYNPSQNRFDHHQEGGAGVREDGIPYASFGLVWKEYGEFLTGDAEIAEEIDKRIVTPIDAADNGLTVGNSLSEKKSQSEWFYNVKDMVFAYRATWKEDDMIMDKNFLYLTEVFKKILGREISIIKDTKEGEKEVTEFLAINKGKTLLIIDKHIPYERVLFSNPYVLLVVSPKRQSSDWSVETVRDSFDTYVDRIELPLEWAGKKDVELQNITGVDDAIFCHNGRFIAVAKSKEGAIKLAHLALENAGKSLSK